MSAASTVLLHGFTGAPSSWDEVVRALPSSRRVFRPAIVGHHGGPDAGAETSWDGEVRRLARIVELEASPGGRGVVLAGYSLGARLALAVALARPEAVVRLVLVSASAGIEHEDERARRRAQDDALAASIAEHGLARFVDRWEALPLFSTQRALALDVRAAHRARRLSHDPAALAVALCALSKGRMPWLVPAGASLDVEVTLLAGGDDPDALASAGHLAQVLPRARVEVVPDAGHDLLLERPGAVAAALALEPPRGEPGRERPSSAPRAPAAPAGASGLRTTV